MITYKDSGVDIEKGDAFVEIIKKKVRRTYLGHESKITASIGGYASLYKVSADKVIAGSTDGVGTKLKLAETLNKHDTIGIDLVAMCVNDLLCAGATPLFFLDYFATGKLDLAISEQVLEGIVQGCEQAECALLGGETAEMPGIYAPGVYDLAGFVVGEAKPEELYDGLGVREGDVLIGIPSSGFHSNGYSLLRQLVQPNETELMQNLLIPTRIYVKLVKKLWSSHRAQILGMAHVTGSGFLNVPRINENFSYEIDTKTVLDAAPKFMKDIFERSKLPTHELFQTWNMGVGLVMAIKPADVGTIMGALKNCGEQPLQLGKVVSKQKEDVVLI